MWGMWLVGLGGMVGVGLGDLGGLFQPYAGNTTSPDPPADLPWGRGACTPSQGGEEATALSPALPLPLRGRSGGTHHILQVLLGKAP